MAAYQSAVAITGQNIANVGNTDYTRQSGRLSAVVGGTTLSGVSPGAGVNLSALQRHIDEAVEARLRSSIGSRAAAESTYNTLGQIEALYNELSDSDLSTGLAELFNSFAALETEPQETTTRNMALASLNTVVNTLQSQRQALLDQSVATNEDIEAVVAQANGIASEIASLNELIVVQESRGSGYSSALRDQRDALLRDLSELMDIQTREQTGGAVNVYIGSEPLVEYSRSRGLTVETELEDGLEKATVRFADNNGTVIIRDGQLAAQLEARDEHLSGQVDQLDELARGLIYELNRVQSTGRGLVGYESITSAYAVGDTTAALNSEDADLTFPIENGSFVVHVRNQDTGETITRLIEVDLDGIGTDTSLESLAADLNAVPGLSAGVTADNRLQLDAASGSEMWFTEDSSGALAALGVGALLVGTDAGTIAINSDVSDDPRLLATSLTGALGDGGNAARFAVLGETTSSLLGNQTIQDFQASIVDEVAIKASAALTAYTASDVVYSSLVAQRESVSGVSLDEEIINLTTYERAYQGATRYLGVLDDLTYEVLSLVS